MIVPDWFDSTGSLERFRQLTAHARFERPPAVALALGAGGSGTPSGDAPAKAAPPAQRAQAEMNAARARMGLLPRKVAKKERATTRGGRRIRIITAISQGPTLLGEPLPVADSPEGGGGGETSLELVASSAPAGGAAPGAPSDDAAEAETPAAVSAPVPVSDDVELAASSVVTEVTLSLRFH